MPRLLRPHIPSKVRCRVVLRQLGELWPDQVLRDARSYSKLLAGLLTRLAPLLGCEVADLHLDHDPALGAREKVFRKGEHIGYRPDANDPEHLFYRDKAAHRIKTHVRGDGAQFCDTVLMKRERRRQKKKSKIIKKKWKWPKRKFPSGRLVKY